MIKKAYEAWVNMRQRCNNPRQPNYHNYGGRGITYCQEWERFDSFLNDMGIPIKKELTIERIDNDCGYCPNNCRWATRREQSNNRRMTKRISYNGEVKTVIEWCRIIGMPYETIRGRLRSGWPTEKVFKVARWHHHQKLLEHQQPLEKNKMVKCECGCGSKFLRFDKRGRPRFIIAGHTKRLTLMKSELRASWASSRQS